MKTLAVILAFLFCGLTFAQSPELTKTQRMFEAVKKNDAGEVKDSSLHWNVNVRDDHKNTPLMFAAMNGNHEIVKYLLASGADPNTQSEDGTTPLGAAALGGDEETVALLLKAGAHPNDNDSRGYSPLMFAAMKGNHAIIGDLIKAGADVNHQARDGKSALMIAATSGDDMSIVKLMDAHANVNAQDAEGNTPIMYAIDYKNTYGFATLYDYTPRINMENAKGETALNRAIKTKQPILILMLLTRFAAVDLHALQGKTIQEVEGNINDAGITVALSELDKTVYRTGKSRSGLMPHLPPQNMPGNQMVSFFMKSARVNTYYMTHSHLQKHIDYINTVYHPAAPIENHPK